MLTLLFNQYVPPEGGGSERRRPGAPSDAGAARRWREDREISEFVQLFVTESELWPGN